MMQNLSSTELATSALPVTQNILSRRESENNGTTGPGFQEFLISSPEVFSPSRTFSPDISVYNSDISSTIHEPTIDTIQKQDQLASTDQYLAAEKMRDTRSADELRREDRGDRKLRDEFDEYRTHEFAADESRVNDTDRQNPANRSEEPGKSKSDLETIRSSAAYERNARTISSDASGNSSQKQKSLQEPAQNASTIAKNVAQNAVQIGVESQSGVDGEASAGTGITGSVSGDAAAITNAQGGKQSVASVVAESADTHAANLTKSTQAHDGGAKTKSVARGNEAAIDADAKLKNKTAVNVGHASASNVESGSAQAKLSAKASASQAGAAENALENSNVARESHGKDGGAETAVRQAKKADTAQVVAGTPASASNSSAQNGGSSSQNAAGVGSSSESGEAADSVLAEMLADAGGDASDAGADGDANDNRESGTSANMMFRNSASSNSASAGTSSNFQVLFAPDAQVNVVEAAAQRNAANASTLENRVAQQFRSFFSEQLSGDIVRQAKYIFKNQNSGEVSLILKPEKLGKVRIRMNLEDKSVAGKIFVENTIVEEAFRDGMDELREAFAQYGFEDLNFEIELENQGETPAEDTGFSSIASGNGGADTRSASFDSQISRARDYLREYESLDITA